MFFICIAILLCHAIITGTGKNALSILYDFSVIFWGNKCRDITTVPKRKDTVKAYYTNGRTVKTIRIERSNPFFFVHSIQQITPSYVGNLQSEIILADVTLVGMKSDFIRWNRMSAVDNPRFW